MISAVFHALIYDPLYNGIVFFVGIIPSHDMGVAVIAITVVVRIIIYPLSRRAIESQLAMKKVAPEVEEVKKKYKNNSTEQSQAIFALYRERGVHPFSGFGLTLIQLPVLIGLYLVFLRGGFPSVDASLLYSFVHLPATINMEFLGIMNTAGKHNIILAALVALSQFAYTRLSMGPRASRANIEATLSSDMARSFDLQARYAFPALFGVISYTVPAAAPLYWLTSNVFMLVQEYLSGKRFSNGA
jgi:YidC/Oxa1 family membrane protein insertase